MFSCKKREPRKEALTAVRKSEILSHYTPGIELGHWDYPPYIKDLQFLGSSTESVDSDESTATSQCHLTPVYDKTQPWKVSAMQLQLSSSGNGLGSLQKATVGSILEVAEKRFYLAPAHIFPGCSYTQHIVSDDNTEKDDSDCEFGGFEGVGEDDEVEFMSQYSNTPEPSDVDSESDCEIEYYSSDGDNEEVPSIELWEEPILDDESRFAAELFASELAETARENQTFRLKIKSPSFTSVELDYALIEVSDNDFLTATLPAFSRTSVCQVGPGDVDVTTITGSGKALTGTLSGRPLYIRFPDTRKYQKAFVVDFAEYLQPGDCGSIVQNARTGDIYGHIFAGSVESKVAYIIPAMDVLEVIERNFNVLPTSNQDMNLLLQSSLSEVTFDANGEHPWNALMCLPSSDIYGGHPWNPLMSPPQHEIYAFAPLPAKKQTHTEDDYTIGWICALPVEFDAARKILDEEHDPLPQFAREPSSYVLGNIGQHNIVIPNPSSKDFEGQSASAIASRMCSTFPSINCGLVFGINSGFHAPFSDVRLGDVVVGVPSGSTGGVVQHRLGKTDGTRRFRQKKRILDAVREALHKAGKTANAVNTGPLLEPYPELHKTVDGPNTGQLLETNHCHECSKEQKHCCHTETFHRPPFGSNGPRIHYTHITPSNHVTEDPQMHGINRDDDSYFEMEAAGPMTHLPCLTIQGVYDNGETNPRKQAEVNWHAAAAAAAYARELLLTVSLEVLRFLCANCAINERHQSEANTETINPSLSHMSMTNHVLRSRSSDYGEDGHPSIGSIMIE